MDVFLPSDVSLQVEVGQMVVGGETILATCGGTMLPSLPLRRRREDRPQRFKRGVFLLPSLFTVANLFCGYACIVYSTRGDFDTAALFIGIAMVLDTLDGFFARLTNSSTAFGVQLDSLADMVSFGLAPAILAFTWGLWPLEAARMGRRVHLRHGHGHAAGALQHPDSTHGSTDKRYFVGMPSPRGRGRSSPSTVYLYPVRPAGSRRRRCPRSPWCSCRRC